MALHRKSDMFTAEERKRGSALRSRGIVLDAKIMGDIALCHISYDNSVRRIVLWIDDGTITGYATDLDADSGAYAYAAVAEIQYGTSEEDIVDDAAHITDSITNHPEFDIELERGSSLGYDNAECYREVIDSFISKARRAWRPFLDTLDLACEACLSFQGFSAEYAVSLMSEYVRKNNIAATDDVFIAIFNDPSRSHSCLWLIDAGAVRDPARLFVRLSERDNLTVHQSDIITCLLEHTDDYRSLAHQLFISKNYYAAEHIIRREMARSHAQLGGYLIDTLTGSETVRGFELEAGRLRRDYGFDDSPGFFITGFLSSPNAKRLIDAVDSHPELRESELVARAWASADTTSPSSLGFFIRPRRKLPSN